MVNYCCVLGCGKNSRQNKCLNFYSLPKEPKRLKKWLKAADREDLIDKQLSTASYRVCSRHFEPSLIKHSRNLGLGVVPTLFLPGSIEAAVTDESDEEPIPHHGVVCNNCNEDVQGHRYKCVSCPDYDLCMKCEMQEIHTHHFMLRISHPVKFKIADNLVQKWIRFFKSEHVTVHESATTKNTNNEVDGLSVDTDTSDDEPITKYATIVRPTSICLLNEEQKKKIKEEVLRVLKCKQIENNKKIKPSSTRNKKKRAPEEYIEIEVKRSKLQEDNLQEVAFADVGDSASGAGDIRITEIKSEFSPTHTNEVATFSGNIKTDDDDLSHYLIVGSTST